MINSNYLWGQSDYSFHFVSTFRIYIYLYMLVFCCNIVTTSKGDTKTKLTTILALVNLRVLVDLLLIPNPWWVSASLLTLSSLICFWNSPKETFLLSILGSWHSNKPKRQQDNIQRNTKWSTWIYNTSNQKSSLSSSVCSPSIRNIKPKIAHHSWASDKLFYDILINKLMIKEKLLQNTP